jgi:hypothetical protein
VHREPHHDLGAFEAAEFGVFGDRHAGEAFGIALEQVEEARIPRRVVEAGALAVHLVRKTAGRDDRDAQVVGVAFDRAAQRLAEPVEAACARNGKLQHATPSANAE